MVNRRNGDLMWRYEFAWEFFASRNPALVNVAPFSPEPQVWTYFHKTLEKSELVDVMFASYVLDLL